MILIGTNFHWRILEIQHLEARIAVILVPVAGSHPKTWFWFKEVLLHGGQIKLNQLLLVNLLDPRRRSVMVTL
jgi:hypothetical protein